MNKKDIQECYTLEAAAKTISKETVEQEPYILGQLIKSANEEELPVYMPGGDIIRNPLIDEESHVEVFCEDLNDWMDEHLSHLNWRFPVEKDEENNQSNFEVVLGETPDYEDLKHLGRFAPLHDMICYGLGIPLVFSERNAFIDHREKDYDLIHKKALSWILDDRLVHEEIGDDYWVGVKKFQSLAADADIVDLDSRFLEFAFESDTQSEQKFPLSNAPFPNPPLRKDDWYYLIEDMMFQFKNEHRKFPNQAQAWATLWDSPPKGYGIKKDNIKNVPTLFMGGEKLPKDAFSKRWGNWSKEK